jgi:hypothetical protein
MLVLPEKSRQSASLVDEDHQRSTAQGQLDGKRLKGNGEPDFAHALPRCDFGFASELILFVQVKDELSLTGLSA